MPKKNIFKALFVASVFVSLIILCSCASSAGSLAKAKTYLNPVFNSDNQCSMVDKAVAGLEQSLNALKSPDENIVVQARPLAATAAYIIAICSESSENWERAKPLMDIWYEEAPSSEKENATYYWLMTDFGADGVLSEDAKPIAIEFVKITKNAKWKTDIENILK